MEKETVLVTGSSRGIGRAIARALAEAGYIVVVHAKTNSAQLNEALQELREYENRCRALIFDIANRSACRQALLQDIERFGTYYGIICNAGISRDGTFAAMEPDDWDSVLRTDLDSFYNVVQPLVMPMVRRRKPGRIVAMSSVSGVLGNRGQVNYSAAKAGLIGAVKALALELASRKITVNAVAPGLIETDMVSEEIKERALSLIPMHRLGTPQEVASAVVFLLSAQASYITRQVIEISGGLS